MATHTYATSELPDYSPDVYRRKALAAGYTSPVFSPSGDPARPIMATVGEMVSRTALRNDVVNAPEPQLQVDQALCRVPGDGSATRLIVVTDSRGNGAQDRLCRVKVIGAPVRVRPSQVVLNVSGQASFEFGPSWQPDVQSGPIQVEFCLADETARPVRAIVAYVPTVS